MSDVFTTVYECQACGMLSTPSYHDETSCEGPVIYVDDEWICGRCGVSISLTDSCMECGATAEIQRRAVPLDTRPDVSPMAIERAIHEVTNERRCRHGRSALSVDHHLAMIAREHSRDMATNDFFAHESPANESTADRYDRADYEWRRCGENISYKHPTSLRDARAIATEFVEGWLDSPGHRENLLGSDWAVEGIGVYCCSDGHVYATQNFA